MDSHEQRYTARVWCLVFCGCESQLQRITASGWFVCSRSSRRERLQQCKQISKALGFWQPAGPRKTDTYKYEVEGSSRLENLNTATDARVVKPAQEGDLALHILVLVLIPLRVPAPFQHALQSKRASFRVGEGGDLKGRGAVSTRSKEERTCRRGCFTYLVHRAAGTLPEHAEFFVALVDELLNRVGAVGAGHDLKVAASAFGGEGVVRDVCQSSLGVGDGVLLVFGLLEQLEVEHDGSVLRGAVVGFDFLCGHDKMRVLKRRRGLAEEGVNEPAARAWSRGLPESIDF